MDLFIADCNFLDTFLSRIIEETRVPQLRAKNLSDFESVVEYNTVATVFYLILPKISL